MSGLIKRQWDWAIVALLSLYMLLSRLRPYGAYNAAGGPYFIGTDPYYHARHVLFTVANFPATLGYDPMTQYPIGTDPGQFGTLFDQLAAALALLWGAGDPTRDQVLDVFIAYPAILGALTVIPVYLLARDLAGKVPALFGALVIALLPGEFLIRSLAGYVDHHVMEALLSTLAVWAVLRAVRAWERAGPVLDALVASPRTLIEGGNRRALLVSLGAAFAFWLYLSAWPPGVLFIGIVGAWIVLDTVFEHLRRRDASPVVLTGIFVFAPLALAQAFHVEKSGFSALNYTWMQPTAALLVALASVALGALSVLARNKGLGRGTFVGTLAGLGLLGGIAIALAVPKLFASALSGAGWITGVGVKATRTTIAEANPIKFAELYDQFGLMFFCAVAGFLLVAVSAVRGMKRGDTLLVVWAVLITMGTRTQSRFLYYLAVIVALLNAELFAKLAAGLQRYSAALETPKGKTAKKRTKATQVAPSSPSGVRPQLLAASVLLLALMPVNVIGFGCGGHPNAYSLGGCFQPSEEMLWREPLVWMRDNTPPVPISLTEQYGPPPTGERFQYPPGAYAVLSWWDYGHQIVFEAERPTVPNPFQQQAPLAARIFTSASEEEALGILDEYLGPENEVRYLIIDDQIAATYNKFAAILVWVGRDGLVDRTEDQRFELPGGETIPLPVINSTIKEMFLVKMYFNDGSGYSHFRLVKESDVYSWIGSRVRITEDDAKLRQMHKVLGRNSADEMMENFGSLNFRSGQFLVPYDPPLADYDAQVEASVKIYERVAGARLVGMAEPGARVQVELPLNVTDTGRLFNYRTSTTAGLDGSFALTVAYSTGPPIPLGEGGTQYVVRADGPYIVTAGGERAEVAVPERAVLGGHEIEVAFGSASA